MKKRRARSSLQRHLAADPGCRRLRSFRDTAAAILNLEPYPLGVPGLLRWLVARENKGINRGCEQAEGAALTALAWTAARKHKNVITKAAGVAEKDASRELRLAQQRVLLAQRDEYRRAGDRRPVTLVPAMGLPMAAPVPMGSHSRQPLAECGVRLGRRLDRLLAELRGPMAPAGAEVLAAAAAEPIPVDLAAVELPASAKTTRHTVAHRILTRLSAQPTAAQAALALEGTFAEAGDNQHTLKEGGPDIVRTNGSEGGNSAAYLAARLKKAGRDDLLEQIGPDKPYRSVRAAAIEAGIVKDVPTEPEALAHQIGDPGKLQPEATNPAAAGVLSDPPATQASSTPETLAPQPERPAAAAAAALHEQVLVAAAQGDLEPELAHQPLPVSIHALEAAWAAEPAAAVAVAELSPRARAIAELGAALLQGGQSITLSTAAAATLMEALV